jgi:acyl-coenzyme A thioesterase PaaI-like protein
LFEKSVGGPFFYRSTGVSDEGFEQFESLPTTAGPWTPDAQHGGPPAALLARGIERLDAAQERVIGRFTMELCGPVPVGPVAVRAQVLRPGRSVALVESELYDVRRDRVAALGRAWLFPQVGDGPAAEERPLGHTPDDGEGRPRPPHWHGGYLDAIEWRWIKGGVDEAGPGVVWMRPPGLVEGEPLSPVQRLLACVDSASGASAALDVREWGFLNTELTVHVLRPPEGEWICLDAETSFGGGAVGLATSDVHDERGLVARSGQALLVAPR